MGDRGAVERAEQDGVMALMHEVATDLRQDSAHAARILGDLELARVERWADSAVVLRARFHLRRVKKAFDQAGIEIPFPQMTLHVAPSRP